jgi:hypothetical protein
MTVEGLHIQQHDGRAAEAAAWRRSCMQQRDDGKAACPAARWRGCMPAAWRRSCMQQRDDGKAACPAARWRGCTLAARWKGCTSIHRQLREAAPSRCRLQRFSVSIQKGSAMVAADRAEPCGGGSRAVATATWQPQRERQRPLVTASGLAAAAPVQHHLVANAKYSAALGSSLSMLEAAGPAAAAPTRRHRAV